MAKEKIKGVELDKTFELTPPPPETPIQQPPPPPPPPVDPKQLKLF
jgi:hypothetical protein